MTAMSMPTHFPVHDLVYALSDTHLSLSGPEQLFFHGTLLAATIRKISRHACLIGQHGKRTAMVIHGDFIDFLAIADRYPDPATWDIGVFFDRINAPETLLRIMDDQGNQEVFAALSQFVRSPVVELIFLVGNHDLELSLPTVQQVMRQRLADGDHAAEKRIRFIDNGTGYRCRVGDRNILFIHGNEADWINTVDFEGVRQACQDLKRGIEPSGAVRPSLGTMLMTRTYRRLRKKFPFLDLVKPEIEDNLPLILGAADHLGRDFLSLIQTWTKWLTGNNRFLLEDGWQTGGEHRQILPRQMLNEDDLLLDIFQDLHNGRLRAPEEVSPYDDLESLSQLLGSRSHFAKYFFRIISCVNNRNVAFCRNWLADNRQIRDRSFDLKDMDPIVSITKEKSRLVGPEIDLLVAGHTHLTRCLTTPEGYYYYNTGTWSPVIRIPSELLEESSEAALSFVLQELAQPRKNEDERLNFLETYRHEWVFPEDEKKYPPLVLDSPCLLKINRACTDGCTVVLLQAEKDKLKKVPGTRLEIKR